MQAVDPSDLFIVIVVLSGLLVIGLILTLGHFYHSTRELRKTHESQRLNEGHLLERLNAAEKKSERLQLELAGERALNAQRKEQIAESRRQLGLEFENLANKIFEDKTRAFDKTSKDSIESLLKPFREQVEGFQKRVNEVHKDSIEGNTRLGGEIKRVLDVGLQMSTDAQNLADALKGDSQKLGSWGETMLETTLQMAGLIEGVNYEKQTSMLDDEGRRKQTDYLVRLPDSKHIVIDSKVSLAAYERAVVAETEEQLTLALAEHVKAVKVHIDDLSGKKYTNLPEVRSPSFVLMFMPIEPAYIEALKFDPNLFSYGYDKTIVLVSHTTLIPILTTVANLWALDRSSREAKQLGDKAGEIYEQVRKVAANLGSLGKSLSAVNGHFEKTRNALIGRQGLQGKVERFEKVSSKVSEKIPEVPALTNEIQDENLTLLAEPIEDEKMVHKEEATANKVASVT